MKGTVAFVSLLMIFNLLHFFIEGDTKITSEGQRLSLNMFESNSQCVIESKLSKNGEVDYKNEGRFSSFERCHIYPTYVKYKKHCENFEKVSLDISISINGNPFYKVVEEEDICPLQYSFLGKNEWIKSSDYEIVGYPGKNSYFLKDDLKVFETPQYDRSKFVKTLIKYNDWISCLYIILTFVFYFLIYRKRKVIF